MLENPWETDISPLTFLKEEVKKKKEKLKEEEEEEEEETKALEENGELIGIKFQQRKNAGRGRHGYR